MEAVAAQLSGIMKLSTMGENASFWERTGLESFILNERPARPSESDLPSQDFAEDSLPTRRSLLSRLRNVEDNESWRTFFDTYWRLLYNVARRNGLADHHAQDVVQDTVIAVARKMPDFRYDPAKGSFKQWLLLICRRRIHDHFRRAYSASAAVEQSSAEDAQAAERIADPLAGPDARLEEIWEEEWRENTYQRALFKARQRVKPKQYQVFDYCVLQNQRPAEVARMLGMSAAQVYLAKHRVSAAVKQAVREIEAESASDRVSKPSGWRAESRTD